MWRSMLLIKVDTTLLFLTGSKNVLSLPSTVRHGIYFYIFYFSASEQFYQRGEQFSLCGQCGWKLDAVCRTPQHVRSHIANRGSSQRQSLVLHSVELDVLMLATYVGFVFHIFNTQQYNKMLNCDQFKTYVAAAFFENK